MTKREFTIEHYRLALREFASLSPNHRYLRFLHETFGYPDRKEMTRQDKDVVLMEMRALIEKWRKMTDEEFENAEPDTTCGKATTILFHDKRYDIVEQHHLLGGHRLVQRLTENADGSEASLTRILQRCDGEECIDLMKL